MNTTLAQLFKNDDIKKLDEEKYIDFFSMELAGLEPHEARP